MFRKKEKKYRMFSWDDISLEQYGQIMAARTLSEDDEEFLLRIISICYKMSFNDLLNTDYKEVQKMAFGVKFINDAPVGGIMPRKLNLGGRKYFVQTDMVNITTAQYIDFQSLAPNCEEHMPEFLSIIIIPQGHKYNDGYNLIEVQEDIKKYLSVKEALSIANFFIALFFKSIKGAVRQFKKMKGLAWKSLTEEQKEQFNKVEELLDGLTAYMQ